MFDHKMSRVRFDNMDAISKVANVVYYGNGWDNYDSSIPIKDNIDNMKYEPDIVVVYKPDNVINFKDVEYPSCIIYNEMWPIKEWTREIQDNNIKLVIAHHENDIPKYEHLKNIIIKHIPHSANEYIYRDYGLDKSYDVLITGAMGNVHYPFRCRLKSIIETILCKKINCKILKHPGPDLTRPRGVIGEKYAMELNKSKIVLTCSSRHKYRLGKYVEIPMCGSILGADLPGQDCDEFKKFMLVLNDFDSDEIIVGKILKCLQDESLMKEKIKSGLEWSKQYTQEKYAERFIKIVDDFLGGFK